MPPVSAEEKNDLMETEESVVIDQTLLASGRTVQDVENVLAAAKLDKLDIQSVTQVI